MAPALLLAALGGVPAHASVEPSPGALEGMALLHQGRFDAASSTFAGISRSRPKDPEGPFFEAFVSWWRLLDRPKDSRTSEAFAERLKEGIRRGEDLLDGPEAQRGRVFAGTALILSAQSHAFSKSYFAAGSDARRGYKYLEEALARNPDEADALFAMGAYKYFAARMPWLVKALSLFLRIPTGDAEAGLAGLEKAASGGTYFRVEADLLLTHIYADEQESDDRVALHHLRAARALEPASPLLAAIEGRLLYGLGLLGDAERVSRESLALAEAAPIVTPAVPALARLRLALTLYYEYRPSDAAVELRPLVLPGADLPEGVPESVQSLAMRLSMDLSDPGLDPTLAGRGHRGPGVGSDPPKPSAAAPTPLDAAAAFTRLRGGEPSQATEWLTSAVEKDPNDPVALYHLARAYGAEGKRSDAVAALSKCLGQGPRLPKTLQGWAMIRMGASLEADGKRAEAEVWYHRAADLKGFVFRRAAVDRLRHPDDQGPPQG